jgi:guanyl-specific ribonuclease Sa
MRRHLRNPWIWVAAVVLCAVWLLWPRPVKSPAPEGPPPAAAPSAAADTRGEMHSQLSAAMQGGPAANSAVSDPAIATLPEFLPDEARQTVMLIANGGPFPHHQDGAPFGNREGHLPDKPRGYYREYTVETPNAGNRGARRIVTGGWPPEVWYYTDDHYDSFRSFDVGTLDLSRVGSSR